MKFIINILDWMTFIVIALMVLVTCMPNFEFGDGKKSNHEPLAYKYISSNYTTVNNEVGCDIKYSEEKKDYIWKSKYKIKKLFG